MALLEIACFSPESAQIAGDAGADRIELCDKKDTGGTTPPHDWLPRVKAMVKIPVFVMIRPRGGDFHFSELEIEKMKGNIDDFKAEADGFVFGVLDRERNVDIARTAELVRRAHPLPCTFHRAFDETQDPLASLEDVISAGCHAILSSGGAANADGGMGVLQALVQTARGRVTVIPGGGVRLQNLARIRENTGAGVFHSAALANKAQLPDTNEIQGMKMLLRE